LTKDRSPLAVSGGVGAARFFELRCPKKEPCVFGAQCFCRRREDVFTIHCLLLYIVSIKRVPGQSGTHFSSKILGDQGEQPYSLGIEPRAILFANLSVPASQFHQEGQWTMELSDWLVVEMVADSQRNPLAC
jgi:hypothetical protein